MAQLKIPVSVTNLSQGVTVAGNYAAQILKNYIFLIEGELVPYIVAANAVYNSGPNTTTFLLTGAYTGVTNAAAAGVITVDFTYPDMIPTLRQGDVGTAAIFTQAMNAIQSLIARPQALAWSGGDEASNLLTAATAWWGQSFVATAPHLHATAHFGFVSSSGLHHGYGALRLKDNTNSSIVTTSATQIVTCSGTSVYAAGARSIVSNALVIGRSYALELMLSVDTAATMKATGMELSLMNF